MEKTSVTALAGAGSLLVQTDCTSLGGDGKGSDQMSRPLKTGRPQVTLPEEGLPPVTPSRNAVGQKENDQAQMMTEAEGALNTKTHARLDGKVADTSNALASPIEKLDIMEIVFGRPPPDRGSGEKLQQMQQVNETKKRPAEDNGVLQQKKRKSGRPKGSKNYSVEEQKRLVEAVEHVKPNWGYADWEVVKKHYDKPDERGLIAPYPRSAESLREKYKAMVGHSKENDARPSSESDSKRGRYSVDERKRLVEAVDCVKPKSVADWEKVKKHFDESGVQGSRSRSEDSLHSQYKAMKKIERQSKDKPAASSKPQSQTVKETIAGQARAEDPKDNKRLAHLENSKVVNEDSSQVADTPVENLNFLEIVLGERPPMARDSGKTPHARSVHAKEAKDKSSEDGPQQKKRKRGQPPKETSAKGGRPKGSKNYSNDERGRLVEAVDYVKPKGDADWEKVKRRFDKSGPATSYPRSVGSLQNQYKAMKIGGLTKESAPTCSEADNLYSGDERTRLLDAVGRVQPTDYSDWNKVKQEFERNAVMGARLRSVASLHEQFLAISSAMVQKALIDNRLSVKPEGINPYRNELGETTENRGRSTDSPGDTLSREPISNSVEETGSLVSIERVGGNLGDVSESHRGGSRRVSLEDPTTVDGPHGDSADEGMDLETGRLADSITAFFEQVNAGGVVMTSVTHNEIVSHLNRIGNCLETVGKTCMSIDKKMCKM